MKYTVIIVIFLFVFTPHAQTQDVNIVYIGNSITQGVKLKNNSKEAPPVQASFWLDKQKVGNVAFRNCGFSGKTTIDFQPIKETYFSKVKEAADQLSKNKGTLLFSIMLGTNDCAIKGVKGAPVLPVVYYSNMKTIIDELLNLYPTCTVVLHRPIWFSPNTYNSAMYLEEGLTRLQAYFPILEKLVSHYEKASPCQVVLGDTLAFRYFENNYKTDLKPENGNAGSFYLHPNKAGAQKLGEYWGKAILSTLPSINDLE